MLVMLCWGFAPFFAARPSRLSVVVSLARTLGIMKSTTVDYLSTSDGQQLVESMTSKNGRYVLAWRDSYGQGNYGSRLKGKGLYWLFGGTTETQRRELERPNDGCIADNGSHSICDWLFTSKRESVYYLFAADGSLLIKKPLKARICSTALSDNGMFGVCHTSHSDHWKHSNLPFLFSGVDGSLIWHQMPPFQPAKYEFDTERGYLHVFPKPQHTHHQFITCTLTLQRRT